MAKKADIRFEVSEQEINRLIDEIESSNLSEESQAKVIAALSSLVRLSHLLDLKQTTIARLRKVFNKHSEKFKQTQATFPAEPKAPGTNQGRKSKDDYPTAEEVFHEHESLSTGDQCPECDRGTLYRYEPGVHIKITGSSPLTATVHRTEKLRCSGCGQIFEADFQGRDSPKYDAKAKAVVALMKYAASTPFYRMAKIQKSLLTPVAASTQWDLMEELANDLYPVWKELLKEAAQAELSHIDDTTAKILSLMKDNRLEQNRGSHKKRFGMWTTGILARLSPERQAVLYFTGHKYAGENLDEFLEQRQNPEPMIIMSDALATNHPKRYEVYQVLCNSHARRKFVDLTENYKHQSEYVLTLLGKVYKNDKHTKEQNMSDDQRQAYHQEHSENLMDELLEWCEKQITEKKVEPNSSLGKGIKYILKHWPELTQFYRVPGVPLDNNILEEKLRLPVLNRKNFLFYRSQTGALVGDIIMSLIKTCDLAKVNALDYLSAIQENAAVVKNDPNAWLPWNFQTTKTETNIANS